MLSVPLALLCTTLSSTPAAPGERTGNTAPVVDQAVTPVGWLPVDVGDVQLSIPTSWQLVGQTGEEACGAAPGVLVFGGGRWCPNDPSPSGVPVVTISTISGSPTDHGDRSIVINGITVLTNSAGTNYAIPTLQAELTFAGPPQPSVLRTLTYSPRYVALAQGRVPTVPRSWRWISFARVRFAVPKAWYVSVDPHESPCASNDRLSVGGVSLVEGPADETVPVPLGPCGLPGFVAIPQILGVELDQGAWGEVPSLFNPPQCVGSASVNELRLCIRATPDLGLLIVQILSKGVAPVTVKIGMAGSGTTGRILLHSLRRS